MPPERFSAIQLLLSCFGVSALASIAQLVRRGPINAWKFVGTILYGGVVGLTVGALLYKYLGDDNYILLIGFSALAGLSGTSLVDFLMMYWSGGGIQIVIRPVEQNPSDTKPPHHLLDAHGKPVEPDHGSHKS